MEKVDDNAAAAEVVAVYPWLSLCGEAHLKFEHKTQMVRMNYCARVRTHSHTSRERKERLKVNTWNRACIDGARTRKHCANTFLFRRKKKLNH